MNFLSIRFIKLLVQYCIIVLYMYGCGLFHHASNSNNPGKVSKITGRDFSEIPELNVNTYQGKSDPPPGMAYVEGGFMIMGNLGEDSLDSRGRNSKVVHVNSFYVDEAPITNFEWQEYRADIKPNVLPEEYEKTRPNLDLLKPYFSIKDDAALESLIFTKLRHHPVVAVSPEQVRGFCEWRTQAINKARIKKLKKQKNKKEVSDQAETMSDESKNEGSNIIQKSNQLGIDPEDLKLLMDSGLYVEIRLLTEAEWEYAARGIVGIQEADGVQQDILFREYPWPGNTVRDKNGNFLALFKRGFGNYKGMAGESNSGAPTLAARDPRYRNELGLYHMVGNVCCLTSSIYNPLFLQDAPDFNPGCEVQDALNEDNAHDEANNNLKMVYRGCSWADPPCYLKVGMRRKNGLTQNESKATVGFRCAMSAMEG